MTHLCVLKDMYARLAQILQPNLIGNVLVFLIFYTLYYLSEGYACPPGTTPETMYDSICPQGIANFVYII